MIMATTQTFTFSVNTSDTSLASQATSDCLRFALVALYSTNKYFEVGFNGSLSQTGSAFNSAFSNSDLQYCKLRPH